MGGVEFFLDEVKLDFSKRFYYQGMMFSGVPIYSNLCYINASWTLRADLNSVFVCDMLQEMDRKDASHCVPELRPRGGFDGAEANHFGL